MAVLWIITLLLCTRCSGQLLNETYGGLIHKPVMQFLDRSNVTHLPTYNGTLANATRSDTSLSNRVLNVNESLSSRMTSGVVGGIKMIIYVFRLAGDFFRKFGAEIRVAKCLFMYSLTYQPFSSKVAGGTIQNWLAGYFGAEDARDVYRFLSRTLFAQLGLGTDL
ncbi:uncharacterized protein LOC128727019 [Anopheles nili]|uniref:uncharacterized protein LOC128727019 n=1 Tax=Anopheles nili TaxID=185578 RepID=UPI00237ACFB2|nr:uncharacterized protein LOC128727019 [Anopheles nili]